MKRLGLVCLIGLCMVMGGTMSMLINHWVDQGGGGGLGPPEGYEESAGRVEKLKIEGSVSKYYDENIDLVAFGPGSGWLRLKTRDGISPEISFKQVTQRDVRRFNWFSKSIGLPIRAEFTDSVLRISAADGDKNAVHLADITEEKIGRNSIMVTGFFQPEKPTALAIRKDRKGKVFLVKVKKVPGKTPKEAPTDDGILMAKTKKEGTEDE